MGAMPPFYRGLTTTDKEKGYGLRVNVGALKEGNDSQDFDGFFLTRTN